MVLQRLIDSTQYAAVGDQIGIAMEQVGCFGLPDRDPQRIPLTDAEKRSVSVLENWLETGKQGSAKFTPAHFTYGLKSKEIAINQDGTYGKGDT